jgi:hypothetical protein
MVVEMKIQEDGICSSSSSSGVDSCCSMHGKEEDKQTHGEEKTQVVTWLITICSLNTHPVSAEQ